MGSLGVPLMGELYKNISIFSLNKAKNLMGKFIILFKNLFILSDFLFSH